MIIHKFEQYSSEWWETRRGVPTASCFDKIFTAKTMKPSSQAEDYACELIADYLAPGIPRFIVKEYESLAMRRGTESEPEARRWFSVETDMDVTEVGLCLTDDGRFGCSPDGLIGDDSGLELKCPLAKTHIRYLLDGGLPDAYRQQVHGSMIVTGRDSWHFMSYCAGFPALLLKIERDDYTEKLAEGLEAFWVMYQAMLAKVQAGRLEVAIAATQGITPENFDTFF